jgi:hypothetical protein
MQNISFNYLHGDILNEIIRFIPIPNFGSVRTLSKKYKNIIDNLLTQPQNVVSIISELSSFNAMLFINYYTQTAQYKALLSKFDNQGNLSAIEIACIALTTNLFIN